MTINGNDIRMIRGDTERLTVTCQLSDGTERPFEEGDTVTGDDATEVFRALRNLYRLEE